jgi:RNA polymerase sigma-70 factor (ECF subfamily)
MEASEAASIERCRAGDTDAFRLLVEKHSRTVFRLAYRMTGNEQDAEDVVQETFLRAFRRIGSFDGRAAFSTWLCSIAANYSLDLLRSRQRAQEVGGTEQDAPAPEASPERLALSREARERVAAALDQLSTLERTAFTMRHFEGVSIGDIAAALGRPSGAVRHCVFRAVQKLRRELQPLMRARYATPE